MDKYMAPATFEFIAPNKCRVAEGGEFCFIAENCPETITANGVAVKAENIGDKFFAVALSKDENNIILEWK